MLSCCLPNKRHWRLGKQNIILALFCYYTTWWSSGLMSFRVILMMIYSIEYSRPVQSRQALPGRLHLKQLLKRCKSQKAHPTAWWAHLCSETPDREKLMGQLPTGSPPFCDLHLRRKFSELHASWIWHHSDGSAFNAGYQGKICKTGRGPCRRGKT